jgi:hypothetical protein
MITKELVEQWFKATFNFKPNIYEVDVAQRAYEHGAAQGVNQGLLKAADQCLDDMGDTGLCVCQAAKDQLRAAIAAATQEVGK